MRFYAAGMGEDEARVKRGFAGASAIGLRVVEVRRW